MLRRLSIPLARPALAAVALCCVALPASSLAAGQGGHSWARAQIKLVTTRQLFPGAPSTFRPQDPLTAGALAEVIGRLTGQPVQQPQDPESPVSMAGLDAALVSALGLGDSAAAVYQSARASGLKPPARFGTEVMARLLGLRINHPVGQDDLELLPDQTATRAEAAYSVAAILRLQGKSDVGHGQSPAGQALAGHQHARSTSAATNQSSFVPSSEIEGIGAQARSFALPALTVWQQRILQTAVSLIGDPYVWGGTSESGMDCSGFVWRVYKLTSYSNAPQLSGVLQGRTTMEMSGEVPKSLRIRIDDLQPGDVLFFGNGPKSKPSEVDHAGIYLGNGWYINSARSGVAVAWLGWGDGSRLAWARRPLAEAGLE
jgi:cell wall-associated NlpC family hydrolase